MTPSQSLLQIAYQQILAESYLDEHAINSVNGIDAALQNGNNHIRLPMFGLTRLPENESASFAARVSVLDHHANDGTGFSATLSRIRLADGSFGPLTLSFRSTEFRNAPEGDRARDIGDALALPPGADTEILLFGYAFGQILAMERYYQFLRSTVIPAGEKLVVTGYSLGGHLATVFTLLHPNDIVHTYTFNVPGVGAIGLASGATLQDRVQRLYGAFEGTIVDRYGGLPESQLRAGSNANIYYEPEYILARNATVLSQGSSGTANKLFGGSLSSGAFGLITNVVGNADHNDTQIVANAGFHSADQIRVFIEDQPNITGLGGLFGSGDASSTLQTQQSKKDAKDAQSNGDFGTTHSITLIADSLALQSLYQDLAPAMSRVDVETMFSLVSNKTGFGTLDPKGVGLPSGDSNDGLQTESDTLELALDRLRRLFHDPSKAFTPTPFDGADRGFGNIDARQAFHENIRSVRDAASAADVIGRLSLEPTFGLSKEQLLANAMQPGAAGLPYRQALRTMSPFAALGVDLSGKDVGGQLSLFDGSTRSGSLSKDWLGDRTDAFLAFVRRNREDVDVARLPGLTRAVTYMLLAEGPTPNIDGSPSGKFSDDTLKVIPVQPTLDIDPRRVVFGSSANESGERKLVGGRKADALYGMEGDDHLDGMEGDDYLEGGAGVDTYTIDTTPGDADTIFDLDGQGRILIDGTELAVGKEVREHAYLSADRAHTISVIGDTLTIDGLTRIIRFRNDDLGLHFENLPDPPPPDAPDVEKYSVGGPLSDQLVENSTRPLHPFGSPFSDCYVGIDYDETDASATLFTWLDIPYVLEPGDAMTFLGKGGDDSLSVFAMRGARFHGGSGNDYIVSNASTTTHVSQDLQVLVGGSGADIIEGSDAAEFILGDFRSLAAHADGFLELDTMQVRRLPDGTLLGSYAALLGSDLHSVARGDEQITLASTTGYVDLAIGPVPTSSQDTGFDDTLYGGGGDDIIAGGAGNDIIHGGDGNDWLGGDNQFDRPVDAPISFRVDPESFGPLAFRFGFAGNDYIDGGAGDDHIVDREAGNVASDVTPTSSYSVLLGGAGSDTIVSEVQGAYVDGGDDNDTIVAYRSATVLGGTGDDTIDAVESWVDGGAGSDIYRVHSHLLQSHEGSAVLTIRDADDPLSSDTIILSNLTWNGGAQWIAFDTRNPDGYPQDILDYIAGGGDPSANDGPGTVGVDVLSTTVTPYREGDDLVLGIRTDAIEFTLLYGVDPILRVQDWFLGEDYQVEQITFEGDGVTWTPDDVNAMVADQEDDVPVLADLPEPTFAYFDLDPSAFDFNMVEPAAGPTELAGTEAPGPEGILVAGQAPSATDDTQSEPTTLALAEPPVARVDSAPRDTPDQVVANLASSQSEIAREVESFFARSQSEPLRESAWLDQWILGGHGGARGEGRSEGQNRTTDVQESSGQQEGTDAPPSPGTPTDAQTPDEVAAQYERMHVWLDAHAADDESVFAPDWSGRSALFAGLGAGVGSTGRQDYLIPASNGLGAPLRGLSEGLQPLALA